VLFSTFSAYSSVFMLLDVDLNGGDGGRAGPKGKKGMGGKGGEPGPPKKIGTSYETIGHTERVTIPGGSGGSNASSWVIPSSTFTVVTKIESRPHAIEMTGGKGKQGRTGKEDSNAVSMAAKVYKHIHIFET
jgi:hypothetical protein